MRTLYTYFLILNRLLLMDFPKKNTHTSYFVFNLCGDSKKHRLLGGIAFYRKRISSNRFRIKKYVYKVRIERAESYDPKRRSLLLIQVI